MNTSEEILKSMGSIHTHDDDTDSVDSNEEKERKTLKRTFSSKWDLVRKSIRKPKITVMVAVDGSEYSKKAFEDAVQLIDKEKDTIHIVHARNSRDDTVNATNLGVIEHAFWCLTLAANIKNVQTHMLPPLPDVSVVDRLISFANKHNCEYIVAARMGNQRRAHLVDSNVMGSVADELIRKSQRPVLVTRPHRENIPEHPLFVVAVDGSSAARRAFEATVALAAPGDHVRVLHIRSRHEPDSRSQDPVVARYLEEFPEVLERHCGLHLSTATAVGEPGVTVPHTIDLYCREHEATFLSMGTVKLNERLSSHDLGSCTARVMKIADTSLFVCK
eukprot:GCRY01005067.1.p1 GENE.GCRY01005067.1~~GCRY01005067.1.p1  ORF type:complete len:332 (+),score=92.61 GCRY01005067.1:115-1110(+)